MDVICARKKTEHQQQTYGLEAMHSCWGQNWSWPGLYIPWAKNGFCTLKGYKKEERKEKQKRREEEEGDEEKKREEEGEAEKKGKKEREGGGGGGRGDPGRGRGGGTTAAAVTGQMWPLK